MKKKKGAKTMYVGEFTESFREEVEYIPKCKYKLVDRVICAQCLLKDDCPEFSED